MKNDLSTMCLFVLLIVGSAVVSTTALSPPQCWNFNTLPDYWTNKGSYNWKFTADGAYPDDTSIPSFAPYTHTLGYAWFQDQATPEADGSIFSPGVTLVTGDIVYATIYRHILDGKDNDSSRPIVRFNNGYGFVDMAYSVYYDQFKTVASLPCASTAPGGTICCNGGGASCSGYLQIDGQVLIRDELLVIDSIGINDDCSGPSPPTAPPTAPPPPPTSPPPPPPTSPPPPPPTSPPPPPPTNPPPACICNFDTVDLCGWSAAYITVGWIWSGQFPTTAVPSDGTDSEFIYIIDTTATVYYPYPSSGSTLTGVTSSTTFSFNYYLNMVVNGVNKLDIYFEESSNAHRTYLRTYTSNSGTWLNTGLLQCVGCCTGSSCSGTINIATTNSVGTQLTAAIDVWSVTYASCVEPPPPTDTCECNFDSNSELCDWSAQYITNGWVWTGNIPADPTKIPSRGSDFFYILDTTADLWYPYTSSVYSLTGVTSSTLFSFAYYLNVEVDGTNTLEIYFQDTYSVTTTLLIDQDGTGGIWVTTGLMDCIGCCSNGQTSCSGTINIQTTNLVDTTLYAAVDSFYVENAVCNY